MKTKREKYERRIELLKEVNGHNWKNVCQLDLGSDSPPPPDYRPVADASKEAAEISAKLGREQLDESRRQYDQNMAVTKPIVEAQTKAMKQAYDQGNYNFENFKTEGRPLQQSMRDIAMGKYSPELKSLMDTTAKENVADVSAALDSQRGETNRNMARMSVNPNSGKFAAMQGVMDLGAATAKASAANTGRTQAIDRTYAKSGDVLNTYSGMASSAPTFYAAGTNAGNSASGNQMSPGNALMAGMGQGANTTMSGRQIAMNGLTGIVNSQTSAYNAGAAADGQSTGALIGGAAMVGAAFI